MVERFGPSRKSMLRDVLSKSFGEGLSSGINSYYAHKDLDKVVSNPENSKKPYSERVSELQRALAPHGDIGASILQQRLGIEAQRQKEFEQDTDIQRGKALYSQLFPGEQAPEGIGTEQVINLAKARNTANKPNKFSPIPEEVKKLEYDFLNDKAIQNLPDEQWYAAGVARDIPPGEMDRLSAIRQERKSNQRAAEKVDFEIHKDTAKYDEDLSKESKIAEKKLKGIEAQEKLVDKIGKWDRFVNAFAGDSAIGKVLKSANVAEYESHELAALEGTKDTFGVRLSDADLRVALKKLATAEKSPEAKRRILSWQKLDAKIAIERQKIADQIKKKNKGLRPIDYEQQIRQQLDARFGNEIEQQTDAIKNLPDPGEVSVLSPSGQLHNIPKSELDTALKEGGRLAK